MEKSAQEAPCFFPNETITEPLWRALVGEGHQDAPHETYPCHVLKHFPKRIIYVPPERRSLRHEAMVPQKIPGLIMITAQSIAAP